VEEAVEEMEVELIWSITLLRGHSASNVVARVSRQGVASEAAGVPRGW
jgi:hypothetical protein